MWVAFACGSAFFAGITAILAKCGIRETDSTVATAIRTIVVLVFAWVMVAVAGSAGQIGSITPMTWAFLGLSGLATGASWLCYFKALQFGDVNKVVPIDKSSTVLTMLLAFLLLGELHRCGIPADTDLCGRGLKAQMKYADKIGAKFTMVLGDNELQQGKAEMKNMKTGEKRKISISGEDFINDYVTVSTEAEDFSQDGIFF